LVDFWLGGGRGVMTMTSSSCRWKLLLEAEREGFWFVSVYYASDFA
jgi:hypothetical protein